MEEEKESSYCSMCLENQPNSVIMSCGHGGNNFQRKWKKIFV